MPPILNPLLLDLPDEFETERLILRAPRHGEGVLINRVVQESLEWLKPWMPWAHNDMDAEISELIGRMQQSDYRQCSLFHLRIIEKASGRIIGACSIFNIDWSVTRVEIGYWIHPDFAGKGYVSEAVHQITDVAFELLQAERVEIRCDEDNLRSAAVAERCGFKKEGLLRSHDLKPDGTLRNTLVFGKIRSEWKP